MQIFGSQTTPLSIVILGNVLLKLIVVISLGWVPGCEGCLCLTSLSVKVTMAIRPQSTTQLGPITPTVRKVEILYFIAMVLGPGIEEWEELERLWSLSYLLLYPLHFAI